MPRNCCLMFNRDGSLVTRQCASEPGAVCPPGWVSVAVAESHDCPPYPSGPVAAPGGGLSERIRSAEDLRFKEWAECRATIGRFDTILVDLRKVGFSLITALLSASAFFGLIGVSLDPKAVAPPIEVRTVVLIVIMALVAALFFVDNYFETLLSGAVERALDLEAQTEPPVRVTKYLSLNASRTGSVRVTLALYLGLLALTYGLALLMFRVSPPEEAAARDAIAPFLHIVAGGLALAMYLYWRYCAAKTGFTRIKSTRQWSEGAEKVAAPPV